MSDCRSLLRTSTLAQNEARILLAFLFDKHLNLPRSAIQTHDDIQLDNRFITEWESLQSRRMKGEPIAYLIGRRAFHNIELQVAPGVLIPRPETEQLVDIALLEIKKLNGQGKILDLGTGSGAIALALTHAAPQIEVTATDSSQAALVIAKKNADLLNLSDRIEFTLGDWYETLTPDAAHAFDVILSNPPYIHPADTHLTAGDLRFEPRSALTDGIDGLTCIRTIISGSKGLLKSGGLIALEHGYNQAEAVADLMAKAGLTEITKHLDLSGHSRIVSARNPI